ncbi:MAG: response regulator [Coriobacteriia bacterium]|nr:response regulator [Coriobacteriia bacterium]
MSTPPDDKRTLLIVDDLAISRLMLRNLFEGEFEILEADSGRAALEIISAYGDSLAMVLLDLVMPGLSGFDVLADMNESGIIQNVPVIVITSENDELESLKNYYLGVSDLIHKPFNAEIVYKRVHNVAALYAHQQKLKQELHNQKVMLQKQQEHLQKSNQLVIDALSTAVEFRNFESVEHIIAIRVITKALLGEVREAYNLTDDQIEEVAIASAVHDIGKVAIPDQILLKPGRLTPEEFEVIKTHPARGSEILLGLVDLGHTMDGEFFRYCYDICRYHHEKWDGSGYPYNLAESEIPIWAQAVSVADIYDALVSERVYKPAYPHEKAIQMILDDECGKINPELIDALLAIKDRLPMMMSAQNEN